MVNYTPFSIGFDNCGFSFCKTPGFCSGDYFTDSNVGFFAGVN